MLRLMRHAASLLDDCEPGYNLETAVAVSTASVVLRMVAAAMDDEPTERDGVR
jgi:hypothetical protein